MILKTDRLHISECKITEASFYFELFNDPDWKRFINDKELRSVDDTETYLRDIQIPNLNKNGLGVFTVYLSDSNIPIGAATLIQRDSLEFVDIGYAYLPKGRGKGYAAEATRNMMDYLQEKLQVKKVAAIIKPENQKSIQLVEKIGFQFVKCGPIIDKNDDNLYLYTF